MTRWRTTWILFGLALALFAFIALFERHLRQGEADARASEPLPAFKSAEVTNISLRFTNELLLAVERSNGASPWELTVPLRYPAQTHAIDRVLHQLETLVPRTRISQEEMIAARRSPAEYGLDLPQATLTIQFQGQRKEIHFGNRTPVGDQVYMQSSHDPAVFTGPVDLFDRLPRAPNDWRDTTLINFQNVQASRFEVRAAGRGFALEVDQTNGILVLTKPTPARADPGRVELLLGKLAEAKVQKFINDNPRADLEPYGLQPPEAEFVAGLGTNDILVVQFGKSPTNDPTSVYARRLAQTNIVLVSKDLLEFLQMPHSALRDRHLMSFNPPAVESVEVIGATNFVVRRQTNGTWIAGAATPVTVDTELMKDWLETMTRLEGSVEADVVTDLKTLYNLNPPARQFLVRAAVTNSTGVVSNRLVAELHLGAVQDEKVFARRPDEASVYALETRDVSRLPYALWQLRDRRVWRFATNQVTRVTAQYHGQSRVHQRSLAHVWNLAPGSQGVLNNPPAIEEIIHSLGELRADTWVARGDDFRLTYGFKEDADRLTLELKNGDKPQTLTLEFGNRAPNNVPYALTDVDDQTRIFEISPHLYLRIVRDFFYPLAGDAK
jgi:hypothetical protein